MSNPFTSTGNPVEEDHNGVNCYGGTDNNEQKVGDVNNVPASDASLPKKVNKYGGTDNNEQPGNFN